MIVFADPVVDWATIGKVIAFSLLASIGVSLAYSLAVLGTIRSVELRRSGRGAEGTLFGALGLFGAAVCIAAIVGGIIVMSSK